MKKLTINDLPKHVLVKIVKVLLKKGKQGSLMTEHVIAELIVADLFNKAIRASARASQQELAVRKTRCAAPRRKLMAAISRDIVSATNAYERAKRLAETHGLTEWVKRMAV
jgi:hypothetical protein